MTEPARPDVSREQIAEAFKKHSKHVMQNLGDFTTKKVCKLLEKDLELETKSLFVHYRKYVDRLLDKLLHPKEGKSGPCKAQPSSSPSSRKDHKKKQKSDNGGREKKSSSEGEKSSAAKQQPRKAAKENAQPSNGSGSEEHAARIKQLKEVCKQAGVKVPPSLYARNKGGEAQMKALKNLLAEHNLTAASSRAEIVAAKREIQKQKELEGIKTENIIEGSRRSRQPVNYSEVAAPKYEELDEDSDEEDDVEVNDECSSEDEGGHESDQEVVVTNGGGLHKKPDSTSKPDEPEAADGSQEVAEAGRSEADDAVEEGESPASEAENQEDETPAPEAEDQEEETPASEAEDQEEETPALEAGEQNGQPGSPTGHHNPADEAKQDDEDIAVPTPPSEAKRKVTDQPKESLMEADDPASEPDDLPTKKPRRLAESSDDE